MYAPGPPQTLVLCVSALASVPGTGGQTLLERLRPVPARMQKLARYRGSGPEPTGVKTGGW